MIGPCMCGDPYCPSCGGAMGTYPPLPECLERERVESIDKSLRQIGATEAADVIAWLIDRLDAEGISPYEG